MRKLYWLDDEAWARMAKAENKRRSMDGLVLALPLL